MKKRFMLTCRDASRLLSKGQEHTLPFRERWALKIHLFFCVSCRNYARQIGWIDQVFHLVAHQWNTYHLSHEAKERIRESLKKPSQDWVVIIAKMRTTYERDDN